ncbi:MAG: hypothetical protein ACREYA_22980 [Cupriavidus necator]
MAESARARTEQTQTPILSAPLSRFPAELLDPRASNPHVLHARLVLEFIQRTTDIADGIGAMLRIEANNEIEADTDEGRLISVCDMGMLQGLCRAALEMLSGEAGRMAVWAEKAAGVRQ